MVLYYCDADIITRSKGKSVVSASAYIHGRKMVCQKSGKTFDFRSKSNIISLGVILPEGAPEWMKDPEKFANYLENFEDKYAEYRWRGHPKNPEKHAKSLKTKEDFLASAQTASTLIIALQKELTPKQNEEWLRKFIDDTYTSRGLAVSPAIHWENENPHAHLIIARRPFVKAEEKGFRPYMNPKGDLRDTKDQEIISKPGLVRTRRKIAEHVNEAFEKANINRRVDHRSYVDRGIDLKPTRKKGWHASSLEEKGMPSVIVDQNNQILSENIAAIIENPEILINKISGDFRDFDVKDLQDAIAEFCEHDESLMSAYYEAMDRSFVKNVSDTVSPKTKAEKAALWQKRLIEKLLKNERIESETLDDGEVRYRLKEAWMVNKKIDMSEFMDSVVGEQAIFTEAQFVNMATYKMMKKPAIMDDFSRQLGLSPFQTSSVDVVQDSLFSEGESDLLRETDSQELRAGYIAGQIFKRTIQAGHIQDIGPIPSGEAAFAKKNYIELEKNIFDTVRAIHEAPIKSTFLSKAIPLNIGGIVEYILNKHQKTASFSLTSEQKNAIRYLSGASEENKSKNLFVLQGRAGAGKTTIMRLVADIYEECGLTIKGVTFQGAAASQLQNDIGRECLTIHKMMHDWRVMAAYEKGEEIENDFGGEKKSYKVTQAVYKEAQKRSLLTQKDVILVDEANMVGAGLYKSLLSEVEKAGAKIIFVGDDNQAKGHVVSDIFRGIKEIAGYVELNGIIRQKEKWMRNASVFFSEHKMEQGLKIYEKHKRISWETNRKILINSIVRDALIDLKTDSSSVVLAYKNEDVDLLNQKIRAKLVDDGSLKGSISIKRKPSHRNGKSTIMLAPGDRIMFTRNENLGKYARTLKNADNILGVRTGDLAEIIEIGSNGKNLTVRLLNNEDKKKCKIIQVDLTKFAYIDYGYAITVSSSEGKTFKFVRLLFDKIMSSNIFYVGMTRHSDNVKCYVDKEEVADLKAMVDSGIGLSEFKPLVKDFEDEGPINKNYERVATFMNLSHEISQTRADIEKWYAKARKYKEIKEIRFSDAPGYAYYVSLFGQRKKIARAIYRNWPDHKNFCDQQRLRRDWMGVEGGLKNPLLSDMDKKRQRHFKDYTNLVRKSDALRTQMLKTHGYAFFDTHDQYDELKALIIKRNEKAALIRADIKGYGKFFVLSTKKVEGAQKFVDYFGNVVETYPIGHKTIFKDAKGFDTEVMRQEFTSSIPKEQKETLDLAKEYKSLNAKVGSLFAEITSFKEANENHFKRGESLPEESLIKYSELNARLKDYSNLRNSAALNLMNSQGVESVVSGLSINLEKVKSQANLCEIRRKIFMYQNANGIERFELAHQLAATMKKPETKHLYFKLLELGVDPARVRFEANHLQTIKEGKLSEAALEEKFQKGQNFKRFVYGLSPEEKDTLNSVREYKKNRFIVGSLLAEQKILKKNYPDNFEQHEHYIELKQRLKNYSSLRNGAAFNIINGSGFDKISERMSLKIDDVQTYAKRHQMRSAIIEYQESHGLEKLKLAKNLSVELKGHENKSMYYALLDLEVDPSRVKFDASQIDAFQRGLETEESLEYKFLKSKFLDAIPSPKETSGRRIASKYYDVEEVREALADRAEDLARHVFAGEDYAKRYGSELRFGKKGSIRVHISGSKMGGWVDFSTGESGTAFDLLTKEMGMGFKEALEYGASFAGIQPKDIKIDDDAFKKAQEERRKAREIRDRQDKLRHEQERAKNIQRVSELYLETKSLENTIGSRYLKDHRNIDRKDFPEDLRFHPAYYSGETKRRYPALVAFARDAKGRITACQATYLDYRDGAKVKDLDTKKRSMGPLQGSFVTVQDGTKDAPIYIAEGLETALSVKEAGVTGKIVVALGISNYRNLPVENGNHVIICKDHDRAESKTHAFVDKAKEALESRGARVSIIQPPQEGDDFNDVLQRHGKKAVQDIITRFWVKEVSTASPEAAFESSSNVCIERNFAGKTDTETNPSKMDDKLGEASLTQKDWKLLEPFKGDPVKYAQAVASIIKMKEYNQNIMNASKSKVKSKDLGIDI